MSARAVSKFGLLVAVLLLAGCAGKPEAPRVISADEAISRAETALAAGRNQVAVDNYLLAARQGDHRGELGLGELYATGHGVVRDFSEATQWLEPAAEAGLPEAQYQLGLIYETGGTGILQNQRAAFNWMHKAAAQGHVDASYHQGLAYQFGRGTPVDNVAALAAYQAASERGNSDAITAIGVLYAQGRGVKEDAARARAYFQKGIDAGNAEAMRQMANLYLEGNGVKQSDADGYAWMRRAAAAGSEEAARRLATRLDE
jgi:TPR repeat protein